MATSWRNTEERERYSREKYEAARAVKLEDESQVRAAINLLNESLRAKPIHTSALALRATLATRLGELQSAVTDLALAIQLESTNEDKRRLAGLFNSRAVAFKKMGLLDTAIQDWITAATLEPDNGTWLFEVGSAYLRRGNALFGQQYLQAALTEKSAARIVEGTRFKAFLRLGECRLRNSDYASAVFAFHKAREIGETATLHYLLGLATYKLGRHQEACGYFRRAVEMDTQSYAYQCSLAVCSFQVGAHEEAIQHITEALRHQPRNGELYFYRGAMQLELGMHAQALTDVEEAIRLSPCASYYYTKGILQAATVEGRGHSEAAEMSFARALDLDSGLYECHVQMGLIAHRAGELNKALVHLHKALPFAPRDTLVIQQLGLVYGEMGYSDVAARYFQQCCTLAPTDGASWWRYAAAQLAARNPLGALRAIVTAMDRLGFVTAAACHVRAVALRQLNASTGALRWASEALTRSTSDEEAVPYHLNRAEVHYNLQQYAEGIEDATQALTAKGAILAEAYYARARCHHARGDMPQALADLDLAGDTLPPLKAESSFCYVRGVVLATLGRDQEALCSFDQAIASAADDKDPALTLCYHERAKVRQLLHDADGAVLDFDKVLAVQPENFNALVRRAFALKEQRRYDEASRDWQTARRVDKTGALQPFRESDFYALPYIVLGPPGKESPSA